MKEKAPAVIDLVLVGGGHSHALLLKMWAMNPISGVRVTLLSDVTHTPYSGMLPGHIGGEYSFDESHIDLRSLASFAGVDYIKCESLGLNLEEKSVKLKNRPDIRYDIVSINIGSTPDLSSVQSGQEIIIPVKPVPNFLENWEKVKTDAKAGAISSITIIGAGAGGVELSLWMRHILGSEFEINIIQKHETILPSHNKKVRQVFTNLLKAKNIKTYLGQELRDCFSDRIICRSGLEIKTDRVFGLTNAKPPKWIKECGLDTNEQGFINVKTTLQSTSHLNVFAAGDIAHIYDHPRAKTGVFAVRMGKPLFKNIQNLIQNRGLIDYIPQKTYLNLIGTGDGRAVASHKLLASSGKCWWTLKNYIDVKFMNKLNNLGPMKEKDLRSEVILDEAKHLENKKALKCLGCGAKVGGNVLSRSLGRIKDEEVEPEVEGIITDWRTLEDAAIFSVGSKQIVTSVDYFPALFEDPFLLGRVAALHSFSDCFAMGADPHSCLLQAQLPMMKSELMEETLYQMVKGVFFELGKMPARLLGGHTTEGILGIGLTANGLLKKVLNKQGMKVGDRLILTKPLGIGVLFAAQMQAKTKGRWIDEAIESMLVSNQKSAQIASQFNVSAMTDVTGFGLLGHLKEMMDPSSKMDVDIFLDALPLLDGALEMTSKKIKSSLFEQNLDLSFERLRGKTTGPLAALGHDPQTSGGLLCFIEEKSENRFLEELRGCGYLQAQTVGVVKEGSGHINLN